MSMYQELKDKADLCRRTALTSNSEWARQFWLSVAHKLEIKAGNLPLRYLGK